MKILDLPISTLAYVGDAAYELMVRVAVLDTYHAKSGAIHKKVIQVVNASAQAIALARIEKLLTEKEKALVHRAANYSVPNARQVDPADYRHATGFEALLGYLFLNHDLERLFMLVSEAEPDLNFSSLDLKDFCADFQNL
ncbi:MAG: Mini-ribonuclease 3 [Clostridiaceae bacterium]|nr:Mini-ribonuclease 3 [Clostridiaceae bacterium]